MDDGRGRERERVAYLYGRKVHAGLPFDLLRVVNSAQTTLDVIFHEPGLM
jgi:hypothetical protein